MGAAGRASVLEEDGARVGRLDSHLFLELSQPDPVAPCLDPECRDIRSNRELARMLQLPLGQNASKTGPEAGELAFRVVRDNGEEIPGKDLVMQRAVRTGEPVLNDSYRIVHPDGLAIDVLGSAAPLFDGDGRIRGAVGQEPDDAEVVQPGRGPAAAGVVELGADEDLAVRLDGQVFEHLGLGIVQGEAPVPVE